MDDLITQVQTVISATPMRWQTMADTISADLFTRKPAPGEWSALECLQHVIDTEHVIQTRIKAFLAGQDFPDFNPDKEGSKPSAQSSAAMAYQFDDLREESLLLLNKITPADLDRKVNHQELGPVTLREMLNEWAGHDLLHLMQAERAMLQPFILGCGPWIVYFKEHLIEAK
jgi:DinB superfamily